MWRIHLFYVTNQLVIDQIDTIYWVGGYDGQNENGDGDIDFSDFENCKTIIISIESRICNIDITLPPNVEELICHVNDFCETQIHFSNLHELEYLSKVSFFSGDGFCETFDITLPLNHFDIIQINPYFKIVNLDEISFDRLEYLDVCGQPIW